jgi:hypothetical protein
MSAASAAIVWFKSTDLRLHDHAPLASAMVRPTFPRAFRRTTRPQKI